MALPSPSGHELPSRLEIEIPPKARTLLHAFTVEIPEPFFQTAG